MRIHSDLAETIGNTPLLRLKRASEMTGCTILGKCEFLNPGQSVKDRAALYIIRDAIARGERIAVYFGGGGFFDRRGCVIKEGQSQHRCGGCQPNQDARDGSASRG